MIYALTDARVVLARVAKKVERGADRMGLIPAIGTQAVLRANGIVVAGSRAWMNVLPETTYPYPAYEIETGEVAIVAFPTAVSSVPKEEFLN